MKNKFKILMRVIVIFLAIVTIVGITADSIVRSKNMGWGWVRLSPGQVWVKIDPNPFNGWTNTYKIIDVKEGYILYEWIEGDNIRYSETCYDFIHKNAKKIK